MIMKTHSHFSQIIRLLTLCCIIGTFLINPLPVNASLTHQDSVDLVESLELLSTGWVQEHVWSANDIFTKSEYTSSDWQEFFSDYFTTHPFTDHLREFLGYPVFYWFDNAVHAKLHTGLIQPLQATIQNAVTNNRFTLGSSLEADTQLRQTLFNSHRFINTMLEKNIIDDSARSQIYNFYTDHINAFPELFKSSVTFNTSSQPYAAALRGQIYMNLGAYQSLTSLKKMEISQTIGLTGIYATIWEDHTVLVIDNNGIDENHLNVIFNYLGKLPANIHDLHYITVNSLLGNEGDHHQLLLSRNCVNIFAPAIGAWTGNAFPNDVSTIISDGFTLVLAHEVNHMVDGKFTNNNPLLAQRRDTLIAAAGTQHMNYLRSMLEDGFFTSSPQEFFASISNQWFSNTEHTLELALTRWQNGYVNPINQFLFFAQVYSQGGDTVPFYTLNGQGQMTRENIAVCRDSFGHIFKLTTNQNVYEFLLNENGNVLNVE
jgi:hypothetical protein